MLKNNIYIYIFIRYDNRVFNNTNHIHKHINQYSTDVVINFKINKPHNVKKTYYKFINGVVSNKHNTINTNGTHNGIKLNKLVHFNVNSYFTKNRTYK